MSAMQAFLNKKSSTRGATILLVVTLMLSNLLGLFRDRLLAAHILPSQLDAYYAAFGLPDLLTNLVVVGAIAVTFLPIFTELRTKDESDAWHAAAAVFNLVVGGLALAALILAIFMPWVMPHIVPSFPADKLALTIRLARWLCLTPIFFGGSYILSSILNSYQRFTVYSLAPLVYNASIIIGTLLGSARYGVAGPVAGVVIGAFLHMLIQLPIAMRLGFRWQPVLALQHEAVKKVRGLIGPRIVGLGALQFEAIIVNVVASAWSGAITYYNFATNIQTMPTAVFGNSIATALFPRLSESVAKKDMEQFETHLTSGMRWIIFLLVPSTVGLILLRIQIVRLVLGAGLFGWEATTTTADVLAWLAISLVATGLMPLLARAFYAKQDTYTPMVYSIISAVITIALTFILPHYLIGSLLIFGYVFHIGQVAAVAIASSIGTILNLVLLLMAVRQKLGVQFGSVSLSFVKVVFASLVMGLGIQASKFVIGANLDLSHARNILVQTFVPIVIGVAIYFIMVIWLQCPEWHEIKKLLQKRISSIATSTTRV